jgi:hypothetical protein
MRPLTLIKITTILVVLLICSVNFNIGSAQPKPKASNLPASPVPTPSPSIEDLDNKSPAPSPEPTIPSTKQEEPVIWYEDRSVIAGALQALAAIIAVLIGFILSMLAERRAWGRRKIEQIREKQLIALLAFLSDIQGLVEISQKVSSELKTSSHALLQLNSNSIGRGAALEASRANLKLQSEQWVKVLENERRAALLRITELRLLKIREQGLRLITECMLEVDALISQVRDIETESLVDKSNEFDRALILLTNTSDKLVQTAIESLHA